MTTRAPAALSLLALLSACGGGLVNQNPADEDGDSVGGNPNLFVETEFIDFGAVELGRTETANLTVRNSGTGDLEVSDYTFSDGVFNTSGIPSVIPAGGNAVINLTFLPTDYGVFNGAMTVLTNDPDQSALEISLRGSVISDADGDGFDSIEAGGDDCDDEDAAINPDADDAWYDGLDSNCDGADDYDQDGDGFQTDVWNTDMGTGGDCQDNNATIHPGATDDWYDGVDSNCDGSDDFDRDGDGFRHPAGGGDDCDDENADKNPDATELFNGLDDDCNGEIDTDVVATNGDVHYYGAAAGNRFGSALTVGDVDEDGYADLIVGAYNYDAGSGAVSIYDGSSMPADGSTVEDGNNFFSGDGSADNLGWWVGFYDEMATGGAHVAVGAPGANGSYGAVYIIPGSDARTAGDTADAVTVIQGGSWTGGTGYYVGRGMAQDLDLDGDGIQDSFGFFQQSSSASQQAYQFLLYGDNTGTYTLSDVDATYSTPGNAPVGYRNMSNGGDLDGDGLDDAIFCDHFADISATNDGGVWALWGDSVRYSNSSATSLATAGTLLTKGENYERHGWQCGIGDDMDGDGAAELWVFNPGTNSLYVIPGGDDLRTGGFDADAVATHVYAVNSSNPWPNGIRPIGDWDGDGIQEVAAGMRNSPIATSSGGQIWVFSSQDDPGEYSVNQIHSQIEGDTDLGNELYGAKLPGMMGDFNGDGALDFVAGDYGWDELDSSGAVLNNNLGGVFISYGSN